MLSIDSLLNFLYNELMLTFIWTFYLFVVFIMSCLIFLQKGENSVSMSQSKFMTPRAMSNFLTKSTYVLIFLFMTLCLIIGIILKDQKKVLDKEFKHADSIENLAEEKND